MLDVKTDKPVMVTGATGYVAGQLIKKLLEAGLTVHGTVRDPDKTEKLKYLNSIAEQTPGNIKYFKANLLDQGAFDEAIKGCQVVFHTASPFTVTVEDPQRDLVDPAQLGTRNVLESVNNEESVKRVVLTSSCAAIYGDNIDVTKAPGGVINESVWNTSSSLEHNPYSFSKTIAEKEAWKMHDQQNRWELVTINPSLVMGPGINPNATSESFKIMKQLGDGTLKGGVPDLAMGIVDVRDVAEAHFRAAFTPSAKGRYITCAHNSSLPEMAEVLRPKFGDKYPLPKMTLPKWLVWLVGPMVDKSLTRQFVSKNIGYKMNADNSKSKKELGLEYRPLKSTMEEFFEQMIDSGLL